jgi:hypothetical protein
MRNSTWSSRTTRLQVGVNIGKDFSCKCAKSVQNKGSLQGLQGTTSRAPTRAARGRT